MAPYRTLGEPSSKRGPGGTSGGGIEFIIGLAMLVIGGYLFLDSVQVTTSFGGLWRGGRGSFGLSLVPVLIGVGMLFFNGRSKAARILTGLGLLIVIGGVVSRMDIYFARTSLFDTLLMLGLMAGGLGLIARSLRPH